MQGKETILLPVIIYIGVFFYSPVLAVDMCKNGTVDIPTGNATITVPADSVSCVNGTSGAEADKAKYCMTEDSGMY